MPIDPGVLVDKQTTGSSGLPAVVSSRSLIDRERHVLAEIAAGKPLPEVLEELLIAVEAEGGRAMRTSVLFLSQDGRHLRHGAAPSLPAAYNDAIDGISVGEGVGCCGTVASRGTPVYVSDIATDPLWMNFRDLALEHGLRACWSTPIQAVDGSMLGTFAIYYSDPRTPTPTDVDTIATITQTAALAIERHRFEERTRLSEQRHEALIRSSSEVRYTLNADWSELRQLLGGGFLADTAASNPNWFMEYIPLDEQSTVRAAIDQAIHNKTTFHLEHRVNRADGTIGWALSRAVPLLDTAGHITEWYGAASDITAKRQADDALRLLNASLEQQVAARTEVVAAQSAALKLYGDIVQSNTAPICAFDHDFRIIAFNQAHSDEFFRIFAYRVKIGDVFPDLFPPEQAPIMRSFMARALAGEAYTVSEEFGDPDLAKPYWEVAYSPLRDAGGRVIGAFHHAKDITDRLRAEAELATIQEALRQSHKMEAVGQLTGGLAHDFNNLLTGISGSLDLLQKRVAQGRVNDLDRYLIAAQGAAKRAAALTHRLLAFSRRQTLDPKPTDVRKLVLGMTDLIRRTVGPEITVETVDMVGLWPALVDPPQLENALLNLCINARDAMPDGGRITIESANRWMDDRAAKERDVLPGQYLSLCVSDTGTGMPADVIARAFDPFFTTKPLGQGTGLGLSMIYGFARQTGGQVRIYSEVGQGTMVCIYLPRHYGEGNEAIAEGDRKDEAPRAIEGETVLVIDDEPTVRMLVTDVLGDLGYQALEAEDGASGLKILQSRARVDLLVTDVGLPNGMNGRQVADAARVLRPDLKVLFITGYAENAVVGNGHLDPGMAVLTKPFAMDDLAGKIRSLIES